MGKHQKKIETWLFTVCLFILAMVVLGGITRLTGSGLSMVDWSLIGNLPPFNTEEWQALFESYKKFPEYKMINYTMSLEQFKEIFWWEYIHRHLGRATGAVYFLPWMFFLIKGWVPFRSKLNFKLLIACILGGMQGFFGWYMVKSGLVKVPHVSHLRLTLHLCTAFLIVSYIYWIYLSLKVKDSKFIGKVPSGLLKIVILVLPVITFVQIAYGALNAGLKLGYAYPEFPKMAGAWIPLGLFARDTWVDNFFFNPAFVHFFHRSLAWFLVFVVLFLTVKTFAEGYSLHFKKAIKWLGSLIGVQFILGVLIVLLGVPVWAGVFHQVVGCFFLLATLNICFHTISTRES
jgi:cytochrome c oxidase assembly protein subunit 15